MTERVTKENLRGALVFYARALESVGRPVPVEEMRISNPYGRVMYLYRIDPADPYRPIHDLPGFVGSAGSGFLTKREAYDQIRLAARVMADLAYAERDAK